MLYVNATGLKGCLAGQRQDYGRMPIAICLSYPASYRKLRVQLRSSYASQVVIAGPGAAQGRIPTHFVFGLLAAYRLTQAFTRFTESPE